MSEQQSQSQQQQSEVVDKVELRYTTLASHWLDHTIVLLKKQGDKLVPATRYTVNDLIRKHGLLPESDKVFDYTFEVNDSSKNKRRVVTITNLKEPILVIREADNEEPTYYLLKPTQDNKIEMIKLEPEEKEEEREENDRWIIYATKYLDLSKYLDLQNLGVKEAIIPIGTRKVDEKPKYVNLHVIVDVEPSTQNVNQYNVKYTVEGEFLKKFESARNILKDSKFKYTSKQWEKKDVFNNLGDVIPYIMNIIEQMYKAMGGIPIHYTIDLVGYKPYISTIVSITGNKNYIGGVGMDRYEGFVPEGYTPTTQSQQQQVSKARKVLDELMKELIGETQTVNQPTVNQVPTPQPQQPVVQQQQQQNNPPPQIEMPDVAREILNTIDKIREGIATKDFDKVAENLIQLYYQIKNGLVDLNKVLDKLPDYLKVKLKNSEELKKILEMNQSVPVTIVNYTLPSEDFLAEADVDIEEKGNKTYVTLTKKRLADYSKEIDRLRRQFNSVLREIAVNYNPKRGSKGLWILKPNIDKKELEEALDRLNKLLQTMYEVTKKHYIEVQKEVLDQLLKEGRISKQTYDEIVNNLGVVADEELGGNYLIQLVNTTLPASMFYMDRLKTLLGSYVAGGLKAPRILSWSNVTNNKQEILNLAKESLANFYKGNPYRVRELEEFLSDVENRLKKINSYLANILNEIMSEGEKGAEKEKEEEEKKKKEEEQKRKDLLTA